MNGKQDVHYGTSSIARRALGTSLRRGVVWLFIGSTSSQVLTFMFGIVLARLLTPHVFGMLVVIQIYTGFVGLAAGGGMGQALVRAKDVDRSHYDAVFTIQFAVGLMIYVGFFLIAPFFASWQGDSLYQDLLRVAALSFPLRPFANLPNSILRRQLRFKEIAVANVATLVLSSIASITLAVLGYGIWSLICGGLIGSFV